MRSPLGALAAGALMAVLASGGCTRPPPATAPAPIGRPALPPLPVAPAAERPGIAPLPPPAEIEDPLSRFPAGEPVTLSAAAADVSSLLVALGESIGISLVVGPEVARQRMTVNFVDVPAREALRAVLAEAGLFVAAGPPEPPWGPVVFYTVPVDIDEASVEMIQARFKVSRTLAEFLVRSRIRP